MERTWRWFGKKDKITLAMLKQIGVEGIVTERLSGEHVGLTFPRPRAPTQPIQTSCTHISGGRQDRGV